jgi:tRNA modification GTPase
VSDTTVSLLTGPGTGAIATVQVRGPRAWELAKHLFRPAGKPLPDQPELNRFWFGACGSDEVVLAVTGADAIEVHCHGGRRVVRWVIEQFVSLGCVEERTPCPQGEGIALLQRAPTLRTAAIILDQLNGAFANEVQRILALLETEFFAATEALLRLSELGNTVGRHLVEPWKVVIAGPPNVGKSSLLNALAGYQRSVVSETAGTTRDAASVRVAFDGWPFELTDTAGLHDADGLEAEGIARARLELASADLVLWVLDGTAPQPLWPPVEEGVRRWKGVWFVVNKADQPLAHWVRHETSEDEHVSAVTGQGIPALINAVVLATVNRDEFADGLAVPFTPRLAELIDDAFKASMERARGADAARLLHEALAVVEELHIGWVEMPRR